MGRQVLPQQPVLVHRKDDDEYVEEAEQDQRRVVDMAEAQQLERTKQCEHRDGRGIGPQLLQQQQNCNREVQGAVADEEEDVLMMLSRAEVAGQPFVMMEAVKEPQDRVRAEQRQREAARDLDQPVQPLQRDADLENLMDVLFPHISPQTLEALEK
jgi:hypothetical protein